MAIDTILDFLNDRNQNTLLIKGYDNNEKLRDVLYCLGIYFDKGTIRTSSMSDISFQINRAFNLSLLPGTLKSTTTYKLGRMKVNFRSTTSFTESKIRECEDTFTLFFPIQFETEDKRSFQDLCNIVQKSNSSKKILITTELWSRKKWDIENYVDRVLYYCDENNNLQVLSNHKKIGVK